MAVDASAAPGSSQALEEPTESRTGFAAAEHGPSINASSTLRKFTSTASTAMAAAAAAGMARGGASQGPPLQYRALPAGPFIEYDPHDKDHAEASQQLEVAVMTMMRYEAVRPFLQQITASDAFIAYALRDSHIRLLGVTDPAKGLIKVHQKAITDLSFFSAQEATLASASVDGTVAVHSLSKGDPATGSSPGAANPLEAVPMYKLSVTMAGEAVSVRLSWHPSTPEVLFLAAGTSIAAIVLPDLPAAPSDDVLTIDLSNSEGARPGVRLLSWAPVSHAEVSTNVAVSGDGRMVAVGTTDGRVVVFDLPVYNDTASYASCVAGPTCGLRGEVSPFKGAAVGAVQWVSQDQGDRSQILAAISLTGKTLTLLHATPDEVSVLQTLELKGTQADTTVQGLGTQLSYNLLLLPTAGDMLHTLHVQGSQASARFEGASSFKLANPIISMWPCKATEQAASNKQVLWLYCMQTNGINRLTLDPSLCISSGVDDAPLTTPTHTPSSATALLLGLSLPTPAQNQANTSASAHTGLGPKGPVRPPVGPDTDMLLGLVNGNGAKNPKSYSTGALPDATPIQPPSVRHSSTPTSDALLLATATQPLTPRQAASAEEATNASAAVEDDRRTSETADGADSQEDTAVDDEEGDGGPRPAPAVHLHRADSRADATAAADEAAVDGDAEVEGGPMLYKPADQQPQPAREAEPPTGPPPLSNMSPPQGPLFPLQRPMLPPGPRAPSPVPSVSAAVPAVPGPPHTPLAGDGPGVSTVIEAELAALRRRLDSMERLLKEKDRGSVSQLRAEQRQESARLSETWEKTTSTINKLVKGQAQALQAERTALQAMQRSETDRLMATVGNAINKDLPARLKEVIKEQVEQALPAALAQALPTAVNNKALEQAVASQVSAAVSRQLNDSFRSNFQKQMLPAFEAATSSMFQQIQATVAEGLTAHVEAAEKAASALANNVRQATQQMLEAANAIQQAANSTADRGTAAPTAQAPTAVDFRPLLESLLAQSNYEEAFRQALQADNKYDQVLWLIKRVDTPASVIGSGVSGNALSQVVLVALMQQVAVDLKQDTPLKLKWIREGALALDPPSDDVKSFVPKVLTPVHQALQHIAASGTPEAGEARIIMHIVNSVVLSAR